MEVYMEIKGTKTEKYLWEAFAGEAQAYTKYTYYASQAKKDGYENISAIFDETARNEKEHAKLWFKALHGGKVPSTIDNLADAAYGENYEWTKMYKKMARTAEAEGFKDIAEKFKGVAKIEKEHEARYKKLMENITNKKVFAKDKDVIWQCRNCGHTIKGTIAPDLCPVCDHPQGFFEVKNINFK